MKNIDFDEIFKDIGFTKEDEERFKQMEKEMLGSDFFNTDIDDFFNSDIDE